ncbi:MAG: hypothetical protein ABIO35_11235 [Nitrobacter sp.]
MGIGEIGAELAHEWHMITQAPWLFLGSVFLVGIAIWKFLQREFATRLANANSTVAMLKERLDRSEVSDAIAITSATQAQSDSTQLQTPSLPKKLQRPPTKNGSISIDSISSAFRGRTELQMTDFVAEHKGDNVIVRGIIRSVGHISKGSIGVGAQANGQIVMGLFADNRSGLAELQIGDEIEFQGQFQRVTQVAIILDDCEFVV